MVDFPKSELQQIMESRRYLESIRDEQTPVEQEIQQVSEGRVNTGGVNGVTNPTWLEDIRDVLSRVFNFGNLRPGYVQIQDPKPESLSLFGTAGVTEPSGGSLEDPDRVTLYGTNFPEFVQGEADYAKESGWHPTNNLPTQHEMGHAVEYNYNYAPGRWANNVASQADNYNEQYSTGDIFDSAARQVKYAIPKIVDKVFGTHIVPTEEEWEEMTDDKAQNFWADMFWRNIDAGRGDGYDTVGHSLVEDIEETRDEWEEAREEAGASGVGAIHPNFLNKEQPWEGDPGDLFRQAARNAGYSNVQEAMGSISGYAGTSPHEAFAEAYDDVLTNGDNATPFSRELIRVYTKAADKWGDRVPSKDSDLQAKLLSGMLHIVPMPRTDLRTINSPSDIRKEIERTKSNIERNR